MAKGETRYQRIHRLLWEGQCGLLPLDLTGPCPKRGGPDHPHPAHPGRVGLLTCRGCEHHAGVLFNNRACTHPKARQVAARSLAETIRTWEAQHTPAVPVKPREADQVTPTPTVPLPSSPEPSKQEGPTQLTMF